MRFSSRQKKVIPDSKKSLKRLFQRTLTLYGAGANPGSFSWRALPLKAGRVAGGSAEEAPAFPTELWAITVEAVRAGLAGVRLK